MAKQTGVEVKLIGTDGNVFSIIGKVAKALKRAGLHDEATAYAEAAMASESYDAVLGLTMETVEVS